MRCGAQLIPSRRCVNGYPRIGGTLSAVSSRQKSPGRKLSFSPRVTDDAPHVLREAPGDVSLCAGYCNLPIAIIRRCAHRATDRLCRPVLSSGSGWWPFIRTSCSIDTLEVAYRCSLTLFVLHRNVSEAISPGNAPAPAQTNLKNDSRKARAWIIGLHAWRTHQLTVVRSERRVRLDCIAQ